MIKSLGQSCVHRICSTQVITDLATVVKELVENSLDAGATKIDIKLHDFGMTSIAVSDNGPGIHSKDHEMLAHKHATSKLASFDDLKMLTSFGFRGEALSSLCAMADLVVTTRTKQDKVYMALYV